MAKAKKSSSTAKASDDTAAEPTAKDSTQPDTVQAGEIADTGSVDEVLETAEAADVSGDDPEKTIADTTPEESTTTVEAFSETASATETETETEADAEPETLGDDRADDTATTNAQDATAEAERSVHPVPVPVAVERRGSAFWPMLLGGALAAGLGFLAAQLDLFGERDPALDVARLTTQVNDQSERLTTLEQATPAAPDMDQVMAPVEEIRSQLDGLGAQIDAFGARLAALEERPISSPDTGLDDAYARELAALQASVEQQRSEIESLLQNALSVEEATAQAAQTSAAQTALAQIIAAVESGQPYAEAVTTLQANDSVAVPEALVAHADTGVATLAVLQAEFPDRSRAALAAARANDPEEVESGLGGFLRRQLGARSVAPRDGTDADAVLSRAEAAMREGRLGDALSEAETLSAAASSALEDWLTKARARHDVQTAAADLAQRLTAN